MKQTRLLLADDHKIVLEGLRNLLEPEFQIVRTVEDGRTLVAEAEKLRPDVIVVDISMPLLNGIEAVRQIKKIDPRMKVVFLTMHPDVTYATRAFDAGASGYVLKHSATVELVTAIREAIKGRTYVTPMIAGELMQAYKEGFCRQHDAIRKLTLRQREILNCVCRLSAPPAAQEILAFCLLPARPGPFPRPVRCFAAPPGAGTDRKCPA